MLNMTKVDIELISDTEKYFFLKKRYDGEGAGGDSHICKRYPKKESKHMIYLNADNLYGYTMLKFLPTSGFKQIDPKQFDLDKFTSNSFKGCVLEVDLKYPKGLCK